jgi:enolase-phosphatase E1
MSSRAIEVSAVLLDIEGTISSKAFVREVLFAYSRERLPSFVAARAHEPETASILEAARTLSGRSDAVAALIEWQSRDEKAPPLKTLQGLVWESGYASGSFRSPVFADALEALHRWRAAGVKLYVYSSGSLKAQDLFFRHNEAGDLRALFSGHFDTGVGAKVEPDSDARIARSIGAPPAEIVFLSDDPREIAAAKAAGFQVAQVVREDTAPDPRFPNVSDFSALRLISAGQESPARPSALAAPDLEE